MSDGASRSVSTGLSSVYDSTISIHVAAVGDLTADGIVDSVVAGAAEAVIEAGNSGSSVEWRINNPYQCNFGMRSVGAVGDLDGNGVADFATACAYTGLAVFLSDPDGFVETEFSWVYPGESQSSLFAGEGADFNGDGYSELVLHSGAQLWTWQGALATPVAGGFVNATEVDFRFHFVTDLNGDGDEDLVTSAGYVIWWHEQYASEYFAFPNLEGSIGY